MGVTESRQKGQEGYHLPQIWTHPEDGAALPPHGVWHYLTSVDTGQLPTARHTPFNWFHMCTNIKVQTFLFVVVVLHSGTKTLKEHTQTHI